MQIHSNEPAMVGTNPIEAKAVSPAVEAGLDAHPPSLEKAVVPDFNEQTNYVPKKTIITVRDITQHRCS